MEDFKTILEEHKAGSLIHRQLLRLGGTVLTEPVHAKTEFKEQ